MEEEVITPPRGGRPTRKSGFTTEGGPSGRPAPEPQGSPHAVRAVPNIFTEGRSRVSGLDRQKDIGLPVDILVDTVAGMQQDLARLREEKHLLRTPAVPQVAQAPRRAAFTTTKVPRFDGKTSWEQYRQVFDAIVLSNGWDNDTAALQLFSHLEGDVAHLVPLPRRLSRTGLVDALTAHYRSPGRLADYRRQFERTTRTVGEDPAIFATSLETLAVKAFGDIGQTARLRLIRDRFIAGHSSCELRQHLDSVPPETPIRDMVDVVVSKPSPDPIYPAYVVGDANKISETTRVAAVTRQKSSSNQLEDLLRRLLTPVESPAPKPEEKLLQQLVEETQSRPPAVVSPPVPTKCCAHSSRDSANDSGRYETGPRVAMDRRRGVRLSGQ